MDEQSLEDVQSDAARVISEKMAHVYATIKECEELAIETGIGFRFRHVWGMGGYYDGETEEWLPSSQSC